RVELPFQVAGVDPLAAGDDADLVGVVRVGDSLEGYQNLHDVFSLLETRVGSLPLYLGGNSQERQAVPSSITSPGAAPRVFGADERSRMRRAPQPARRARRRRSGRVAMGRPLAR